MNMNCTRKDPDYKTSSQWPWAWCKRESSYNRQSFNKREPAASYEREANYKREPNYKRRPRVQDKPPTDLAV